MQKSFDRENKKNQANNHLAFFLSQVPLRAVLCRQCRPGHLPRGECSFICRLPYVIHPGGVWPIRWDVSSVPRASPQGVKLLSYLYNEAQNNCSNENYPVLLSLLKSSCEPYTRSGTVPSARVLFSGRRVIYRHLRVTPCVPGLCPTGCTVVFFEMSMPNS